MISVLAEHMGARLEAVALAFLPALFKVVVITVQASHRPKDLHHGLCDPVHATACRPADLWYIKVGGGDLSRVRSYIDVAYPQSFIAYLYGKEGSMPYWPWESLNHVFWYLPQICRPTVQIACPGGA